jgi:hypothetical protein
MPNVIRAKSEARQGRPLFDSTEKAGRLARFLRHQNEPVALDGVALEPL